jgi:hypothetical protein
MTPEDIYLRAGRAARFDRLVKRFDLVWFRDIADWLAREPGRVARTEANRTTAIADLRRAVLRGEFGPPGKPEVLWLADIAPVEPLGPGHFPLRPRAGQIARMHEWGSDMTADLWAPRTLFARWFSAQRLDPPPWLTHEDPVIERGMPAQPHAEVTPAVKHKGGRPPTVAPRVAEWFERLSDKDRMLTNHALAESYLSEGRVAGFDDKVDTVRKIIGRLREGWRP